SLLARLVTRRHHAGTTPASRRGRRSAANGLWLRDPGRLMRRLRRICLIALGALVGLYIAATAAWAVDTHVNAHRVARHTTLAGRIRAWVAGLVHRRKAPVRVVVDERAVRAVVDAKDPGPRAAPVEPVVKAKSGGSGFQIVDGKPGKGIDPMKVLQALPTAAA